MPLVEIVEVALTTDSAHFLGCAVDSPKVGQKFEGRTLTIQGWVVARGLRAIAVEVVQDGRVRRRSRIDVVRRDVAAAFPDAPAAASSGFEVAFEAVGPRELRFELVVVREDQVRIPLAVVAGRDRWNARPSAEQPPLVSIVIPCFDQARFLGEAIESVLAQSHPNVEIVVVDDGSSDNTSAVAGKYPGVRCVRQSNQGLAAARNTGIRETIGEYLVFLDADDRLVPEAVQIGLAALAERPECAFVSGHHRDITTDGRVLWEWRDHSLDGDPFLALLKRNYIPTIAAAIVHRSVFRAVGNFDSRWDACADYDFYLRVARRYPISCHHRLIVEYRRHGTNMSRDPALMLAQVLAVLDAERPFVRKKPALRAALRQGSNFYRAHFGGQLAENFESSLWLKDWKGARRDLIGLLRHYPEGLWKGRWRGSTRTRE